MDSQVKLNLYKEQYITICMSRGKTFLDLTVYPLHQWFSNLSIHQNYLEGLLKHRLLGPIPKLLIQYVYDRAQECAFLPSSQVMLMLAGGLRAIF